ncbi:MAG: serine/threonine protein kinase [Synechocystis sp.]|nr:serine/threonine protein kinase [Synechocystis sp.]
MTSPFKLGQLFQDRYLIQLDLGQGRLSHNYLANDTHRFDEPCVVKAFCPDSRLSLVPDRALNLFQQQARTLYSLEHPQIANFREFFHLPAANRLRYYLVQDFVEGQTYQDLLILRQGRGERFTETEIKELYWQLFPLLTYLHDRGVFHRQLTPANIVRRDVDALPMLVGFSDAPVDDLGGWAAGKEALLVPSPGHDLFCLGVTGVTLLLGHAPTKEGQSPGSWQAQLDLLPLSPEFRSFLLNLLSISPGEGFESAEAALAALPPLVSPRVMPGEDRVPPLNPPLLEPQFVDNANAPAPSSPAEVSHGSQTAPRLPPVGSAAAKSTIVSPPSPSSKPMLKSKGIVGLFKKLLLLLGLMAIATGVGWGIGKLWLNWQTQAALTAAQGEPDASPPPKTALELKNEIRSRRLNLGLSPQAFQTLVNDWLAVKNNQPPLDPTTPPPGTEDEQIQTAIALLTALETLSPEALNVLETHTIGDRQRWTPRANRLRLSSHSFNDLVNARFRHSLPAIDPDTIEDRPLNQLWNALALDSLLSLEDESHYQRVSLGEELSLSLSGQFDPGAGYAYALNIPQGQWLDLTLTAPPTVRISFYSPSGQERMLENSTTHQWSGPLNETGYYELVITDQAAEPVSFQLQLQIRDGSSTMESQ